MRIFKLNFNVLKPIIVENDSKLCDYCKGYRNEFFENVESVTVTFDGGSASNPMHPVLGYSKKYSLFCYDCYIIHKDHFLESKKFEKNKNSIKKNKKILFVMP